jgi:hypothetical protein
MTPVKQQKIIWPKGLLVIFDALDHNGNFNYHYVAE